VDPLYYILLVALAVAAVALVLARYLYRQTRELHRQTRELRSQHAILAGQIPIRKTAEKQQDEQLERQLEAVLREGVIFGTSRIMGRGEYELFRAALSVTRQPMLALPFYVFPQVSLGQIIRTTAANEWQARQAHPAINSKRCDLLIADRYGNPIAVLEYHGAGHDIGGSAGRRDQIKRIALGPAGVRYIEIPEGTSWADMQRIIRQLLSPPPRAAPNPALYRTTE
jgi:hypothetical protein